MTKDTGGPAFPCVHELSETKGMTLRDYFAAQALAAIIQADGAQFFASNGAHAMIAYEHADAMLAERSKP